MLEKGLITAEKRNPAQKRKEKNGEEVCEKKRLKSGEGKRIERENVQQQPACHQRLTHSRRLTPSPPEEVSCPRLHWERSSKHEPERRLSCTRFTRATSRLRLLDATVNEQADSKTTKSESSYDSDTGTARDALLPRFHPVSTSASTGCYATAAL